MVLHVDAAEHIQRKTLPHNEVTGKINEGGMSATSVPEVLHTRSPQKQNEEAERKARVDAAWEQMNKGVAAKMPKSFTNISKPTSNKVAPKNPHNWMTALGLMPPKKAATPMDSLPQRRSLQTNTSDEAKRIAAAALSAVRDATAAAAASASGRGKVEITEVRDFAGEEVEVKKLVDVDSKEAKERVNKVTGGPPSAVDAVLEQIKKKQKLSVLDKTKKDWGEYKEENKGLEEELDAYKKSSNQYLDKVDFLQRTDYREFERERDARLALQAKRKVGDTRDDP